MKNRITLVLLLILSSISMSAQNISHKELRECAWEYIVPKGAVMGGPIVVEFTDSMMIRKMYFRGSHGTLTLGQSLYYLSDTDGLRFEKKRVGKKTEGKYLLSKNVGNGDVSSDLLIKSDANTLQVTKGDLSVDRYRKVHPDTLAAYKAGNDADLNKALEIMNALHNIKTVDLEVPGQFFWMMENKELDLRNAQGLVIRGPLRSVDILQLREMLMGDEAEYPKIKILDLSRAWIVTDTLSFANVFMNYDHEQFMAIGGHHYKARLSDFMDADALEGFTDPDQYVHAIRHGYGTTIEVPAMPKARIKNFQKKSYLKYLSTTQHCIPEFMLENMQNVEVLILPYYTRELRYAAFQNCKKIRHVTIPPYVNRVEQNVFAGCAKTFTSENAPKPEPFVNDGLADTLTNDSLRAAFRIMMSLRSELNDIDGKIHQQTVADSIKAYRAKREKIIEEMQGKMIYYALIQADPTVAPLLMSRFDEIVGHEIIHGILCLAKDAIVFSPRCTRLWQDLFKRSDLHQLDPVYNDPSKMYHVQTNEAGTLRTRMTNEEWDGIKMLRISGPLNKKDLEWLTYIKNHLLSLDLSEAVIDEIPEGVFRGYRFHYLALPKGLRTIRENAFQSCRNLTEIHLGDSLREIGKGAFHMCEFQKITLPPSLRKVGMNAFTYNPQLTEIEFPEGTDTIARDVLTYCSNLERVKLPASVHHIGPNLVRMSPNAVIEIDPDNPNYTVVEGELVGKDDRTKVFLKQKALKKQQGTPAPAPKVMPTSGKYPQAPPMGVPVIVHYKMVKGKKVPVSWEVKDLPK